MTGHDDLTLTDADERRLRKQVERNADRERALRDVAGIGPGSRIADVGCGPGANLGPLAEAVGSGGHVVGVDADPEALARADRAVREAGWSAVELVEADVDATGLPAGSFDAVVLRLVLAHNGGREQAIVEHAASLLRPGGSLIVTENVVDLLRIQPPVPVLTELYDTYHAFRAGRGHDGSVGLRLGDLVEDAGLELIDYQGYCTILRHDPAARGPAWAAIPAMLDDGVITDADVARWERELDELARAPQQPRMFLVNMSAVARRP